MELNVVDMEAVASLKEQRGYQLLIDMVWEQILSILDDVYLCDNEARRLRLVSLYEATRWIWERLKMNPDMVAQQFEERKRMMEAEQLDRTGLSDPLILNQIIQEYKKRQKGIGNV